MHELPPSTPTITLDLPDWRGPYELRLDPWYFLYIFSTLGDIYGPFEPVTQFFQGTAEMPVYSINTYRMTIQNPRPYQSAYLLHHQAKNETILIQGPEADLRLWLPPPNQTLLGIASHRWGHDLVLRHPNGDGYPIIPLGTAGDLSYGPNWPCLAKQLLLLRRMGQSSP